MLLELPLCDLMNPGCVVVVWVTNKQKHLQFVTEQLFPSKNIKYTARWYWLKVNKIFPLVFQSLLDLADNSVEIIAYKYHYIV